MTFGTYPIPDQFDKLSDLDGRLSGQQEALQSVVASAYGSLDNALNAQQAAINKVGSKLTRSLNGRVKSQASVASGVVGNVVSALDSAILSQGSALSLQSAVISRLAATSPQHQPAPAAPQPGASPPIIPGGMRGATPASPTVPFLPPGVVAPSFSLSPQEVIPQPSPASSGMPPQTQQGPPATVGGAGATAGAAPPNWMVLADCSVNNWVALDTNDPEFEITIARGQYVPLRQNFGGNYDSAVQWGRLHHQIVGYQDYEVRLPNPTKIACEARATNGQGWPVAGDFGSEIPNGYVAGDPVGDWPFDQSGQWIGG